ncbi:hypothetical protein [Haloferula rosea]|uniref:Uncharacterized protein n=1 Tax=Haloferula rosea TaxID=490093 RepID=A0A934RGX7_9BACT|nr:hypothetical protein [Haloferula rosea]MBK1829016.1 hypothetical protein [Haloferula rosea]
MKDIILRPLGPACFVALCFSSCAIKDATDMRNKMAAEMAPPEGLRSVWNTSTPLTLGNVYYRRIDAQRGGSVLTDRYGRFVERSNSSDYRATSPVNATWRKDIDSTFSLKPQLGYMGLSASPTLANTRTIRFSAEGNERHSIKEFDSYVDEVLNSPGTGPELRKRVFEDSQRLATNGLPVSEARYWIVTDLITVKNLSVDFLSKPSAGIEVSVADVEALKQFMQVNGLAVNGSASGNTSSENQTTVKSTDPVGLMAWCVPLTATKSGSGYRMRAEEDHPILMANTLE